MPILKSVLQIYGTQIMYVYMYVHFIFLYNYRFSEGCKEMYREVPSVLPQPPPVLPSYNYSTISLKLIQTSPVLYTLQFAALSYTDGMPLKESQSKTDTSRQEEGRESSPVQAGHYSHLTAKGNWWSAVAAHTLCHWNSR